VLGLFFSFLSSCAIPEPPLAYESLDLMVQGEWSVTSGGSAGPASSPKPTQAFCGDETFLARPLQGGQEIAIGLDAGADSVLHLEACVAFPDGASTDSQTVGSTSRLQVVVGIPGREPLRRHVPLTVKGDSRRGELSLGSWTVPGAVLRLRAALDREGTVWLREVRRVYELPWAPPRERTSPKTISMEGDRRLQVLFISVDTLREDALSALGGLESEGEPLPTPALDRFVAESQVFRPHYAAAGWTRPSHGTLLTGLSPVACGALGDKGALRPGLRTLAERFREAGYRTAALVYDMAWFHPRYGFDRGFETYRRGHWRLERAVPEVASWVSDHRDEPFLFFFHTFEPHSDTRRLPYESRDTTRETVRKRFAVDDYGCREKHCASRLLEALDQGLLAPLPRDRDILHFLYARSAVAVDRELGRLFDLLRRLGLYDDLLIVLTSDHGEVLLDHGQLLHGKPWEEVIRVPLVIKWPGGQLAGTRVTTPTGAVDLVPTLLEAAGIDAADLPGTSLRRRRRADPVFIGHNFRAVIHEGLKAVFSGANPPQLFDLKADPGETHNLLEERPEVLERLRRLVDAREELDRKLAQRFDRPGDGEGPGLTPEEKRQLRALGYLGGDG